MLRLPHTAQTSALWVVVLSAAGVMVVSMGARQSLGLFLAPLDAATGLGLASISLTMAVGQFVWGAVQPIAGAVADRYGPRRVLQSGLVLLALGSAMTPFMTSAWGLAFSLGLLSAVGSGIASFSVLIGAAMPRLPIEARGAASGIINAGGSFGQFLFAPLLQRLIQGIGWVGAMEVMALIVLAALPLVWRVAPTQISPRQPAGAASVDHGPGPWQSIREACRDRSYLLLHAVFFTCGFHIAFLVTHLPGEVALCGLPPSVASWSLSIIGLANIAGSLFAGACVSRYRSKLVLFWMYGSRAVLIALYLAAPRTDMNFYLFAAGLGFTWLATVPPTATLVGKLFGTRHLGTLFGLTLLSHQTGAFLGAWLGGLAISRFGDYTWMWYADMALAALAALVNLPIREARMPAKGAAPAN